MLVVIENPGSFHAVTTCKQNTCRMPCNGVGPKRFAHPMHHRGNKKKRKFACGAHTRFSFQLQTCAETGSRVGCCMLHACGVHTGVLLFLLPIDGAHAGKMRGRLGPTSTPVALVAAARRALAVGADCATGLARGGSAGAGRRAGWLPRQLAAGASTTWTQRRAWERGRRRDQVHDARWTKRARKTSTFGRMLRAQAPAARTSMAGTQWRGEGAAWRGNRRAGCWLEQRATGACSWRSYAQEWGRSRGAERVGPWAVARLRDVLLGRGNVGAWAGEHVRAGRARLRAVQAWRRRWTAAGSVLGLGRWAARWGCYWAAGRPRREGGTGMGRAMGVLLGHGAEGGKAFVFIWFYSISIFYLFPFKFKYSFSIENSNIRLEFEWMHYHNNSTYHKISRHVMQKNKDPFRVLFYYTQYIYIYIYIYIYTLSHTK
jgi:hypothetical protein